MKIEKTAIEQCVTGLKDTLDSFILDNKEEHAKILEQTTKTNGSVRNINLWRAGVNGQMKAMGIILGTVVIPLVFLLIDRFI